MISGKNRNPAADGLLPVLRAWINPFFDPLQLLRAMRALPWFLRSLKRYKSISERHPITLLDIQPKLHDRTVRTPFDPHYFWMCGWAMRRITDMHPIFHVDIGSHHLFINLLSAIVPTIFVDYRPLVVRPSGLQSIAGDILRLPFADATIPSLSCLHVAEHIGLGRYGDPLNPLGTEMACKELARVLAPCGHLFFAVPVGRERVCFNAHRVYDPKRIVNLLSPLELLEFTGIDDNGLYHENIDCHALSSSKYACGLYLFRRSLNSSMRHGTA